MNTDDTNIRLMLAVADDDSSAFETLMTRFQGRVLSLLRYLVGDRDIAEDLTQEVFLRVFRARKTYRPEAKFTTWLFTIANNVAINQKRSWMRKPETQFYEQTSDDEQDKNRLTVEMIQASTGTMPARQLDKLELREMVRCAIDTLNERQRMAVLLNRFEGLSYAEIAETMSLTPQAVKSLLSRAHMQLRDKLSSYIAAT
ncbi:RNA polymerase sigma factor [Planctomycetales bacterium]|nr:RNA polymerase sigma factor [Planctomycetales bacterium]